MRKHLIRLHSSPTRYLLSDVLPYEIPASISNRGIYRFIEKYKIHFEIRDGEIKNYTSVKDTIVKVILKLLFLSPKIDPTKAYTFKIHVRDDKERIMSIIHPSSQVAAMAFIERFKEQILYQCSISSFSIRTPCKIASVRYYYDYSHGLFGIGANDKAGKIEEIGKEYETIRSYFTYKEFSNIYKFYESGMHHKLEKKFRYLAQVDISSCFDSIYTHSIVWAIYGKEVAKSCRSISNDMCFPDMFDMLIRNSNYAETNGIPIGSEFSRIFAEIIMQRIDFDLKKKLDSLRINYRICRYIDDYFIFYNNPDDYKKIKRYLIECLTIFNLRLNESKESNDQKLPLITSISIAKNKITAFFNELKDCCGWETDENRIKHFKLPRYTSEEAIIRYKTLTIDIEESRISNYLLTSFEMFMQSIIDNWINGCRDLIKDKSSLTEQEIKEILKSSKKMSRFFQNVIMFLFFILSADMPVNSFIIVSRIIMLILKALRISRNLKVTTENNTEYLFYIPSSEVYRELIHKIQQYIKNSNYKRPSFVEQLMLINVAAELEGKFYLDEETLLSFINENDPDYMKIVVVMRYIRNLKRYRKIKSILVEQARVVLKKKLSVISSDQTMLTFDMLACPYIPEKIKIEILDLYVKLLSRKVEIGQISSLKKKIIDFIEKNGISFTNWSEFSLAYELEFKRAEFVY